MTSTNIVQTHTPHQVHLLPEKRTLVEEFVGKPLNALRTPAMVIDRSIFADNCARMHENAKQWGTSFRAHLKSHKTAEGARLQLQSASAKTDAIIVSTMMEAWGVVKAGLVADGTVKDILYGLPVGLNKIADLRELWDTVSKSGATVRLLIDHPSQVHFLEEFENQRRDRRRWSVFVKIDGGQGRAGVPPQSSSFHELLHSLFMSPATSVYGFYCHAGNSYASTSLRQASQFLSSEVEAVNTAAEAAQNLLAASAYGTIHNQPFVLSVGSTPTAHVATAESRARLTGLLHGTLELHAGNYPMLDLQQISTSLVNKSHVAQRVLATVISRYPGRGKSGEEAMCDAGGIAMSKDTGPSGGYGEVIGKSWRLNKVSQEHGILERSEGSVGDDQLEIGSMIEIVGQHACLIAAAYPWYYIVDSAQGSGSKVVDIWVPWKGW